MKSLLLCGALLIAPFVHVSSAHGKPSTPAQSTLEAPVEVETLDPLAILPPAPEEAARQQETANSQEAPENQAESTPAVSEAGPTHSVSSPVPPDKSTPPITKSTPAVVVATARNESLRTLAQRKGLALPLPNARVVVHKAQRRLDLMSGSTLVKSYRVALGQNPVGHKLKQGDSRTPEGRFYICTRNAKTSAFHIFLGLSYPGLPDARRAVNNKQITWREYQIINQRLASRGRPPWETNLGGWVGIHGGTDAAYAQKMMAKRGSRDWTAGCIALTNREIEEIHAATKIGTPVDVRP